MSLNQRVTAEFSTCTPSAPPTADLSIQTIRPEPMLPANRTELDWRGSARIAHDTLTTSWPTKRLY